MTVPQHSVNEAKVWLSLMDINSPIACVHAHVWREVVGWLKLIEKKIIQVCDGVSGSADDGSRRHWAQRKHTNTHTRMLSRVNSENQEPRLWCDAGTFIQLQPESWGVRGDVCSSTQNPLDSALVRLGKSQPDVLPLEKVTFFFFSSTVSQKQN